MYGLPDTFLAIKIFLCKFWKMNGCIFFITGPLNAKLMDLAKTQCALFFKINPAINKSIKKLRKHSRHIVLFFWILSIDLIWFFWTKTILLQMRLKVFKKAGQKWKNQLMYFRFWLIDWFKKESRPSFYQMRKCSNQIHKFF